MTNGLGDKDLFELIALNAMEVMAWICYLFRSCTCCMNCLCCIILEIWIMQVSTFHYWNQATNKKTITMGSERVGHHTYFKPKSVLIWWTMRTKEDRNLHLSFIINHNYRALCMTTADVLWPFAQSPSWTLTPIFGISGGGLSSPPMSLSFTFHVFSHNGTLVSLLPFWNSSADPWLFQ